MGIMIPVAYKLTEVVSFSRYFQKKHIDDHSIFMNPLITLFRSPRRYNYIMQSNNRAPALHILHNFRGQSALIRETHFGCESGVGHPFSGVAGCSLFQHAVDLFEGEALGFGDEDVGVEEAADAEGAPDEEDFGAEIAFVGVDHVGGDDCDDLGCFVSI